MAYRGGLDALGCITELRRSGFGLLTNSPEGAGEQRCVLDDRSSPNLVEPGGATLCPADPAESLRSTHLFGLPTRTETLKQCAGFSPRCSAHKTTETCLAPWLVYNASIGYMDIRNVACGQ